MQVNALVFNCHACSGEDSAIAFTSPAVEFPGMPWAHNRVIMQGSIRERSASMRTPSLGCVELTLDIAEQIRPTESRYFSHAARR